MTELALVLAIGMAVLGLAAWLARRGLADTSSPAEERRTAGLVDAGVRALFAVSGKGLALVGGATGALLFAFNAFVRRREAFDPAISRIELAAWSALALAA